MRIRALSAFSALVSFAVLAALPSSAQSLKRSSPTPLQPGVNAGNTDSFTGPQYWYAYVGPGDSTIFARFKSAGILGASLPASLSNMQVVVSDPGGAWSTSKNLHVENNTQYASATFKSIKLKKKIKVIVAVVPPSHTLVREGGDYEITLTGAVAFDPPKAYGEPIVQTFASSITNYGNSVKFKADGTLMSDTGVTGTWTLFDKDAHIYAIAIGPDHLSLKYSEGHGLVQVNDPTSVVFGIVH